jgi:hypothetical protein
MRKNHRIVVIHQTTEREIVSQLIDRDKSSQAKLQSLNWLDYVAKSVKLAPADPQYL